MRSLPASPRALRAVALSLLLVVSAAAFGTAAVGSAAAADARVTLTDTTVTPATPTAGAPITAETTLRLSAGSDTSMTVDEVRVVDPSDGDAVLGTATDLGRLSPGETLDVPVTFTVNESGSRDLQLVAVGTDSDGDRTEATRPLTVGVEPGAPQVEVETDQVVAGAESTVQATVSNPTTAPLRGVEVTVAGGESRQTVPTLAAGASETVNLTAVVPDTGDGTVEVRTRYITPNGVERESVTSAPVTVESLSTDVGIRVQRPQNDDTQQAAGDLTGLLGGGGSSALQSQSESEDGSSGDRVDVTVTNFGNTPVDEVVLTAEDSDGARLSSVGRFALADTLSPGDETTVTVDLSRVQSTDGVRFVASYESPEGRSETALRYGYRAQRGKARLTGLDVSVTEGGRVTVDGNLANVGDGEVTSAVVAVQPAEGLQPAYPQRDYFVGTVDASSFAPFELTAQADVENATQVPIQVTYAVDGEQVTRNATVPLPPAQSGPGGGPVSPGMALAILLGLAAAAGATVYVTRYR
ncbi:CARDB domain-containing protein [Haloarcula salinisoli]|uniref:CARDB domain-containing protein n=1 Tax=Haloarcula salinisoli TaxID=2487746 RepID=A0A8J8CA32_9EURY|nr:CARDB domain-containing protein [Halomicroarcula salinisoli]MBX0285930.1 hypothetical protein [Halomicroarcula salinisoli]MBX0302578.1 hypothetical protein [Halomicroarcula salinisoli]